MGFSHPEISKATVAISALMSLKGVGRRAALKIVDGPITGAENQRLLERVARNKIDQSLFLEALSKAGERLVQSVASGVGAYSIYDPQYPARLRNIPDPPAILYVKGSVEALAARCSVAVVGTREPTEYGSKVAQRLAVLATEEGFVIVSGLAHGCDTFGHLGCVEASGVGVAVLAHGLDKVYPAANKGLARDLLDLGGCLVSEYPLGMAPARTAFAERDRIQSGLSDGVLVIETDIKGGTMHTVRFSREQRRPLACIDHPAHLLVEPKTQGNQMMIAEKWARPIADGKALLNFLHSLPCGARTEDISEVKRAGSTQTEMDL
jgi:DNA processing protein